MLEERGHRRGAANESSRLDGLLTEAVTGAGAHIGAAYLLDEGGQVLQMAAVTGLPAPIARAWSRVRTGDPIPIAVAVREQRLIWITGREQLAREFPEAALTLPYHFAAALSPRLRRRPGLRRDHDAVARRPHPRADRAAARGHRAGL
ncbi:hypothetical protein [Nonomuraea salmonea]|uniref:hypothetical protein n=1 Tax=Nonomuraea salmonea TaxID=46181 RepID=UPI002FEBA565